MQPLDIRPDHLEIVRDILAQHVPDAEVWVFGSRAKWLARDTSDLDICIKSVKPVGFERLGALREALEESNLPYKVDVVDWATTSESFRKIIERDRVVVQKGTRVAVSPAPTFSSTDEIEWRPFTELLSTIIDNRGRTCPVGDSGIPLIATNCIDSGSLYPRYDTTRYVSAETYRTWFRGHPKSGDVLFVCKGSPGRTNWTPDPVDFCIAQDMVAVRADPKKIYPKYLFAALRSSVVLSQIDNMHVGTMIPHFKKGDFDKLSIPVPNERTQHEIGDFYFAVSERIDLIRKTNATLEAIAQALFKSWFVDFDPVRAKAEGREPEGVPPEIAEHFPSTFEDSEIGEIPKGWRVGRLGDIVVQRNERTKPSFTTEQQPYVPIECISSKSVFLAESKSGVEAQSSLIKFHRDDILFGAMRPYFHKVCLAPYDGTTRTTAFVLVARKADQTCYCLFQLFAVTTIDFATNHSEGSTIPYAKWNDSLEKMPVVIPSDALMEHFSTIAKAFIARGIENMQQARLLSETRDLLLPRLMSGQLNTVEADS